MKKKMMLLVCFVMILCMAGCGLQSEDSQGRAKNISEEEPDGAKVISEEVLNLEKSETENGTISALGENNKLPNEGSLCGFRYQLGATEEYDSRYKDWGYYCYEHDARAPIVFEICSGEHSTGGYKMRVVDLEADDEGNLCVIVEETGPKAGDIVTEAFTYPMTTLLIFEETKMPSSVTVKTTGGTELPFLGNMPPKSETDEEDTIGQGEKAWEKVVIAPPEGAFCNISLCLPKDWGFECSQTEDVPVSDIVLSIYPKAEGRMNGSIAIEYAQGLGICGTGLTSVETTFNGHAAHKGTYDDHPYWDFITLSDDYSGCAIVNLAGTTWFDKYQKELEEILATVEFTLSDGSPLKDFSRDGMGEAYGF